MAPRNLVNLNSVGKEFAARTILDEITLGIADGDRIGVVGANGAGKSTLLELVAGTEQPDRGALTRVRGLRLHLLDQGDHLPAAQTVGGVLIGDRAEHEWAGDKRFRAILDGLLGGVSLSRFAAGPDTPLDSLSGGERRRIALAQALVDHPDLLLLDEPTNHLDVEAIDWLAHHLAARAGALMVVTHDRWFLDAVCTHTWEVANTRIHQYEGGYAAYVLARAERDRIAAAREEKRQQLVRKELAWLRRGPPARTSKPKFRIEAANALIADEPPVRDSAELMRFSTSRLGKKVLEAERVSYRFDDGPAVIRDITWLLGPGERIALVGTNGSGKTTLLKLLAGELEPATGQVVRGETVRLAYLSQDPTDVPEHLTALQAIEEIRRRITLADGRELTAGRLAERLGFRGERSRTLVRDLSGGERRRLVLARLLMGEPNVLLLDEPTNDLDIDTLTALEDLLDSWPGTIVVVSHDRYFVERVCDNVFSITPGGGIRHLPGGIDQYLQRLAPGPGPAGPGPGQTPPPGASGKGPMPPGAQLRAARKQVARLERELDRLSAREQELQEMMAESATDHERLRELDAELRSVVSARELVESDWLEVAETLEG